MSTPTSGGTATTPAANSEGGAREAFQHLLAVGASLLLPLALGETHHLTTPQLEQLGIGALGFAFTYGTAEAPAGWRKGIKKVIPIGTGIATAIVPLAVSGGSLSALTGVAGAVPILHVLAGLANVVRPNVKTTTAVTATTPTVTPGAEAYTAAPAATTGSATPATVNGAFDTTALTTAPADPATPTA